MIRPSPAESEEPRPPRLTVVIPCLNEAETLATCIEKAQRAMAENAIPGQVLVADNGSSDGSQEIARRLGARLVQVERPGYGSALMAGIEAAEGELVVMGDADDSYDFSETPRLYEQLRAGNELVLGCRLPAGGGKIEPGAMPFTHRWFGNPFFSFLARWWFRAPIHDVYCGLRGFTRELYDRLELQCTGMEFATEMIIRASLQRARITSVPITLHRDGRVHQRPHLKTYSDGWRTLRLFLLFSPRWLFLVPGLLLLAVGAVGYALALPGLSVAGMTFDAHTLLVASLAVLCGYQAVVFGLLTKIFAITEGLLPKDPRLWRLFDFLTLERGILVSLLLVFVGCAGLLFAIDTWRRVGYGPLDYASTMRWVIPSATLTALGFQTLLWSFFVSILGMSRR